MRPIATEKAVMMIEKENILTFETSMRKTKKEIKEELIKLLKIQIDKIRTHNKRNKKYVYVKLKGSILAIDVATKLGLM